MRQGDSLGQIKRPIHSFLIKARRKASRVIRAIFFYALEIRNAAGWRLRNEEAASETLRIGLDIARLALREMVDIIVVVTGDSDLVPAFRFARREGVRVFLDHMGHGVRRELKAHADIIL